MVEPTEREPPSTTTLAALLTYGTNVTTAVLSLVNVLIISRALGPTGRGNVAFLTTITFLTANLAMAGVQESNANVGARHPERRAALATNAVLLAAALGALGALGVVGLVLLVPDAGAEQTRRALLLLALATIPFVVLQGYLAYLVQSDSRFTAFNVSWLLQPVTNVVVNSAFAATGALSVETAFSAWVAGQVLATALLVWYVARRMEGFGRPDLSLARSTLAFGLKAHGGRIMMLGNYRLDQWLLGAIAGARELGLYSVAVAWSEMLFFLPTVFAYVQRPGIVRASPQEAVRQAAVGFRVALIATAGLALVLVVAAPILCVTMFGEEFRGSVIDLRILAPGALGMVALKLLSNAMTAQGRPLRALWGIGAAFGATVVLDVALLPSHGDVGASIASTTAYLLGGFVIAALFTRDFHAKLGDLVPRFGDVPWLIGKVRAAVSRG
jgi:O-antigen/teichoic acid export membrane protein